MSRTPAKITQADVARAIRAAKQAGAEEVEVKSDGTLLIRLKGTATSPIPVVKQPRADIKL